MNKLERIIGLTVSAGCEVNTTGIIEFTAVQETNSQRVQKYPATWKNVDPRLVELMEKESILSIESKYWESLRNCLAGESPMYQGKISRKQTERYGLLQRPIVRVYEDGIFIPVR